MSDGLVDDASQVENTAAGGKPGPHAASEHDGWMGRWHNDMSYYRAASKDLDSKSSPSSHYGSDTTTATQTAEPLPSPPPKLHQKVDPGFYNSDADDSGGEPSPFTFARQGYAHPLFSGMGLHMPPWAAPLPQHYGLKGPIPGAQVEGAGAFPPAYTSPTTAAPHVSHVTLPLPSEEPPAINRFNDLPKADHDIGSSACPETAESKQDTRCSDCAGLRRELEYICLQLAAQQSSLSRIATELAILRTSNLPPSMKEYAVVNPPAPPPSAPAPPPWRNPHSGAWVNGIPHLRPQVPHPSVMRLSPFPPDQGLFWNGWSWTPLPMHLSSGPGMVHYAQGSSPTDPTATSATGTSPVKPGPPPNTPAETSPLTKRQPPQVSMERNNAPSKHVSFACPMTQGELDSDDSSEDTLVSRGELSPVRSLRLKTNRAISQQKKTPPPSKKSSPNSSARSKPYPIAGSLKHRPTVYSPKSPRSFYGHVAPEERESKLPSRLPNTPQKSAFHKRPSDGTSPFDRTDSALPFVVPADEGGDSSSEDLHVRFDASTLFNFMQYWQPRADGPQPLQVDLSLDPVTYEDFLRWGCDNGSIRL